MSFNVLCITSLEISFLSMVVVVPFSLSLSISIYLSFFLLFFLLFSPVAGLHRTNLKHTGMVM